MATVKLTLSLEETLIKEIENLADKRGVSLSEYLGEYLTRSFPGERTQAQKNGKPHSDIGALRGILKQAKAGKPEAGDDKYAYLKEKYDL